MLFVCVKAAQFLRCFFISSEYLMCIFILSILLFLLNFGINVVLSNLQPRVKYFFNVLELQLPQAYAIRKRGAPLIRRVQMKSSSPWKWTRPP